MKRTIITALSIWKRRGLFWPGSLAFAAAGNVLTGIPRGLIVEPSQNCTGKCLGCAPPEHPSDLSPSLFAQWLMSRPQKPVTIHFSGRHSDPLAAPELPELVRYARKHSSMVSVSTIGLGFTKETENLPVDRWIFSIPAATGESWKALRGHDRLHELKENLRKAVNRNNAMVELVLTVWKQSASDLKPFLDLAEVTGVHNLKIVSGRFDPEGHHIGKLENLALDSEHCPYRLTDTGEVELKAAGKACPLTGTLFLDATGTLRPCPFCAQEDPIVSEPAGRAWKAFRADRTHSPCRLCP